VLNNYRDGIDKLIENLDKDFSLSVLSGDNDGERPALSKIFPAQTIFLFNQKPEDKLKYIQDLKNSGEKVLMLGDGLNDAGALVMSDVGVAVTEDVTSFTPASEAILDGRQLRYLNKYIKFSITSRKIIIASFIISFLYNLVGMSFALLGLLTPIVAAILMPISSISVVFFATFAVNGMAKIRNLV
jgi:Cu+-exporting ATPase